MNKKVKHKNKFHIVSLLNKKSNINFNLIICIILTIVVFIGVGELSSTLTPYFLPSWVDYLWFVPMGYLIYKIWKWYRKQSSSIEAVIKEKLFFFLHSNNLYTMETKEYYDSRSNKMKKEKIIANSVILGYMVSDNEIIIRAYKQGDCFTDKLSCLDSSLCALLALPLENKVDKINYCDYIFSRYHDRRIVVNQSNMQMNNTVYIPLSSNLQWNILKQPHLLLAGVTGSGKTTFLNYLILEMKKNES